MTVRKHKNYKIDRSLRQKEAKAKRKTKKQSEVSNIDSSRSRDRPLRSSTPAAMPLEATRQSRGDALVDDLILMKKQALKVVT